MAMTNPRRMAQAILNGFETFFGEFRNVTLCAQTRFEQADWKAVHEEMQRRLSIYKKRVGQVADIAATIAGSTLKEPVLWQDAKAEYAVLVREHNNFEIAQTFFNSVYCFIFAHERIRDVHAFVITPERPGQRMPQESITRNYHDRSGLEAMVQALLADTHFNIPFENLQRDVGNIVGAIESIPQTHQFSLQELNVEILESLFYRNKAAYLVGRIRCKNSGWLPFVLPILNNERGAVYVDALLFSPDAVSILFSFTRSYFMVDVPVPSRYVAFLKSIMPNKEVFELYSAMGFGKHGKTEFYRHAVSHTIRSSDPYVIAPGIKGMVMLVFTRPSFGYVYKVIKERFTPPKDMTREQVKDKYFFVKRWDRAGRMADTQEFTNLAFDRRRFSPELMEELQREVPSLLEVRGNALIIKHVYVERKMIPLNLYLRDATDEQVVNVMDEYGNAIKQLASVGVFPGDMLLKNFGVTRHGRVVFYDYDEICPLDECNFRTLPKPQTEEQLLSGQPWYDVAANDVFPEEFRLFFSGNRRAREAFEALHADLYQADFWIARQHRVREGRYGDIFPYRRRYRFPRE